ncbi:MAG: hypothetical protein QXI58_05495, partial [Candidatus Micrarchaeia archaeon]
INEGIDEMEAKRGIVEIQKMLWYHRMYDGELQLHWNSNYGVAIDGRVVLVNPRAIVIVDEDELMSGFTLGDIKIPEELKGVLGKEIDLIGVYWGHQPIDPLAMASSVLALFKNMRKGTSNLIKVPKLIKASA